jgi:hypothetical protein
MAMVGLIGILFNLSRAIRSHYRSIWTIHLEKKPITARSVPQLPSALSAHWRLFEPLKHPNTKPLVLPTCCFIFILPPVASSLFSPLAFACPALSTLHYHRGHHPMKVRWIRSLPHCLYLVPVGFVFGISFVHIRNFFIATDVLLQKKPLQYEQPCRLVARGGIRTPDDVVCYLGMKHSPRPTIDCWSRCSSPPRTTNFDKNCSRPYLWRDFCITIVKLNARWLSRCSIYWNVNASTSKYQLMCQTEIYHYCTTIVKLNARWLTMCSIYWTINDSRSKYQLMCWRHHTFLDTRPWYRGNQFIELCIHSYGPTTPSSHPFPTQLPCSTSPY